MVSWRLQVAVHYFGEVSRDMDDVGLHALLLLLKKDCCSILNSRHNGRQEVLAIDVLLFGLEEGRHVHTGSVEIGCHVRVIQERKAVFLRPEPFLDQRHAIEEVPFSVSIPNRLEESETASITISSTLHVDFVLGEEETQVGLFIRAINSLWEVPREKVGPFGGLLVVDVRGVR
jgi:hypothetical protein